MSKEEKKIGGRPCSSKVHLGKNKVLIIVGETKNDRRTLANLCKENILTGSSRQPPDFGLGEALEKIKEIVLTTKPKCLAIICCCAHDGIIPADFIKAVKLLPQILKKEKVEVAACNIRVLVIGPPEKNLGSTAIQYGADDYLIMSETQLVKFLREKLAQLVRLRTKNMAWARRLIDEGKQYARENFFHKAIEKFLEAHEFSRQSATAKFLVGNLYEEYGDYLNGLREASRQEETTKEDPITAARCYEEAVEWYSDSIHLNPLFIKAITALSGLYRKQGSLLPESAALDKLKKVNPGSPETYLKMGRNSLETGRDEEARQLFLEAIDKVKDGGLWDKTDVAFDIAKIYEKSGRYEEAERNLRQSLAFIAENALTRKKKMRTTYKKTGGEKNAGYEVKPFSFEQRQKAIGVYRSLMTILLTQAKKRENWRKIAWEAIKTGEEALHVNPVEEEVWKGLADAYEMLGHKEKAAECFYQYRFCQG